MVSEPETNGASTAAVRPLSTRVKKVNIDTAAPRPLGNMSSSSSCSVGYAAAVPTAITAGPMTAQGRSEPSGSETSSTLSRPPATDTSRAPVTRLWPLIRPAARPLICAPTITPAIIGTKSTQ